MSEECFQVGTETDGLGADGLHGGESKDVQSSGQRSSEKWRGIAESECSGAVAEVHLIGHLEACVGSVSPPPGECGREELGVVVAAMEEEGGEPAGTGVEELVGAPGGEVGSPLVEMEWDVADGVCQIPAHHASGCSSGGSDGGYVEELSGVELYPGQENEGKFRPSLLDEGQNVGSPETDFPLSRLQAEEDVLGLVAV